MTPPAPEGTSWGKEDSAHGSSMRMVHEDGSARTCSERPPGFRARPLRLPARFHAQEGPAHLVQGAHDLARLLVRGVSAPVRVERLERGGQAVVLSQPQRVQGCQGGDLAGTAVPRQEAGGAALGAGLRGTGQGCVRRHEGQVGAAGILVARVDPEQPLGAGPVPQLLLYSRGAAVHGGRVKERGQAVHLLSRICRGQVAKEGSLRPSAAGRRRAVEGQTGGAPGQRGIGGELPG